MSPSLEMSCRWLWIETNKTGGYILQKALAMAENARFPERASVRDASLSTSAAVAAPVA
jgi:hypothetical protein